LISGTRKFAIVAILLRCAYVKPTDGKYVDGRHRNACEQQCTLERAIVIVIVAVEVTGISGYTDIQGVWFYYYCRLSTVVCCWPGSPTSGSY